MKQQNLAKNSKAAKTARANSSVRRSGAALKSSTASRKISAKSRRSSAKSRSISAASRRSISKPRQNPAQKRQNPAKNRSFVETMKQIFLPRAANDYRPHLIRRYGLGAILALVLVVNGAYFWLSRPEVLGDENITAKALLDLTNSARKTANLPSLSDNSALDSAASAKARDMFRRGYWSHNAPDGTTPWHFIDASGYKYAFAGENLARGFQTSNGVISAWLKSPTHRANIMDKNYTNVGFAVISGRMSGAETILVVAMYGKPETTLAQNLSDLVSGGTAKIASAVTETGRVEQSPSLVAKLSRGIDSLTPSLIFTLVLMAIISVVSLLAHAYRRKLPPRLRRTWYRHHALIKLAIAATCAFGSILLYGGGVI